MKYFNNINLNIFNNPDFYWQTLIFMIIAYLIGSINFGHIFSKINKTDVGKIGSKNYGATNVGRNFGIKGFIFVFVGDFLKSFVALGIILGISSLAGWKSGSIGFALFFVLVGHIKPIYFKFKGGKGVSSFVAIALILNWVAALFGLLIFVLILLISRRVSIASVSFAISASIFISFIPFLNIDGSILPEWSTGIDTIIASWLSTILIVWKHKVNLKKVYTMEESYVSKLDDVNVNFKQKVMRLYKKAIRNLNIYFYNTKTIINEIDNNNNFLNNDKIKNSKINILDNEEMIKPYKIDEKQEIIVTGTNFSPSSKMNYIFEVNNLKNIKKYEETIIMYKIKDNDDLNDLKKQINKYNILVDVSKGRFFAEKAIAFGAKMLKIDHNCKDKISIIKLCQKKKIPLTLHFSYEKIDSTFLIKKESKEIIFFHSISEEILKIEDKYKTSDLITISIENNDDINILEVLEVFSIIYKNPIIVGVKREEYREYINLIYNLKLISLNNYILFQEKD